MPSAVLSTPESKCIIGRKKREYLAVMLIYILRIVRKYGNIKNLEKMLAAEHRNPYNLENSSLLLSSLYVMSYARCKGFSHGMTDDEPKIYNRSRLIPLCKSNVMKGTVE